VAEPVAGKPAAGFCFLGRGPLVENVKREMKMQPAALSHATIKPM